MSPDGFDAETGQRVDVPIDGPTGKRNGSILASAASCAVDRMEMRGDDHLRVVWTDGVMSDYSTSWLRSLVKPRVGIALWGGELDLRESVRVRFSDLLDDNGRSSLGHLLSHGILLVSEMPEDAAALSAFAAAVSGGELKEHVTQSLVASYKLERTPSYDEVNSVTDGPLKNLYGSLWSTNSTHMVEGTSVADSAYTSDALPVHTDMTYYQHPPGLQVFNMVSPATIGGESVFVDGFAVAEELRKTNPKAFDTLCRVENRYRCIDPSTGWHLEAKGTTLVAKPDGKGGWGELEMIRHNDLDRLPAMPPVEILENGTDEQCQAFYTALDEAHLALDELMSDDRFRVVIKLNAGEMVAVANQRVLHGRQVFTMTPDSSRSVSGCYVSQDELDSRFRVLGLK